MFNITKDNIQKTVILFTVNVQVGCLDEWWIIRRCTAYRNMRVDQLDEEERSFVRQTSGL